RERIVLALRLVRVVADRLQREHRDDALVALAGVPGVHLAAHLATVEEGWLLVDEQCEAPGAHRLPATKRARQLEHCRDTGPVVIRPRRPPHGIVVGAADDALAPARGPFEPRQHVAHACAAAPVFLALSLVTRLAEAHLEMGRGNLQAVARPDVVLVR